jgi:hypothetical protein
MDIQVAVLCDAATDSGGKLNILGAFDTIQAMQLPVQHPQCSVALRLTFGSAEEGEHKLQLSLVNEDGQSVFPGMEIPVRIVLPEDSHFATCNFVFNLQQLKFETPGYYSVDLALDGKPQASIPLLVKYLPPPEASE